MAASDKVFSGSIPEFYDRYMVPLIFEPYAADLAERLAKISPRDVLETAAGTGVLTRALAARLPLSARIVASDLNQPMLDYAAARHAPAGRVEWKQADALSLPFKDESFDVVVCQFGAMFFPDKVQGYKEARRVLRRGGHFVFNVWDKISENEFPDVIAQALAEVFPQDPPRFMARTPHGYHDVDKIRAELNAAGFTDVSIDALDRRSKAASARDVATAYCQGTPWRNEIEARDPAGLQAATASATAALEKRYGTGALDGRIRAYVAAAVR
jgi:ubiquinone/menaquinone biosynthesis C-methylase UbiE